MRAHHRRGFGCFARSHLAKPISQALTTGDLFFIWRGRVMSAKLPAVAREMLPSFAKARDAIIHCSTIDEVKGWRDKAAAVRAYCF
jgi:hypothetical protein